MYISLNGMVVVLPASKSLDINWNYGSMLGMILGFQIVTGLFLSMYYTSDSSLSFWSVQYIMYCVSYGWGVRVLHFNGASLMFMFMYMHIFKGLFNCSYRLVRVWGVGVLILFMIFMEAFMGYVLVWAQMSFWACIVITSLLSVIPFFGSSIVSWVWGGYFVNSATLKFFFVLHFMLPWVIFVLVFFHLIFLHESGSTSLLGVLGDFDKVSFYPYYWFKDCYNLLFWLSFFVLCLLYPFVLGDPEMFLESTISASPVHIKPEWYFLFAYAILRAFDSKLVGIIFMVMSIFILWGLVSVVSYVTVVDKLNDFVVFFVMGTLFLLTWVGNCALEFPFMDMSFFLTLVYYFGVGSIYLYHLLFFKMYVCVFSMIFM